MQIKAFCFIYSGGDSLQICMHAVLCACECVCVCVCVCVCCALCIVKLREIR